MLISFLKVKRGTIALCICLLAIFNSGLFLYNIAPEVFIYIDILSLCVILPYFIISGLRYCKHAGRVIRSLDDHEDIGNDEGMDIIEDAYLKAISELKQVVNQNKAEEMDKYRDIIDYYTIWAHQIKTPIAAMRLLLEGKDEPSFAIELLKIEEYVEMVLSYLKIVENDRDYHFAKVDLDKVIKEEIRYYRSIFIQKKIRLDYKEIGYVVLSDEKWLAFIIGQILSNALKYTKNGGMIAVSLKEDTLYIKDSGIGIAKEDLPMVFEKGFSGTVGHKYKRATGIGLYLAKKYCDILDIDISITSVIDEGTTVALHFKSNDLYFDHLT